MPTTSSSELPDIQHPASYPPRMEPPAVTRDVHHHRFNFKSALATSGSSETIVTNPPAPGAAPPSQRTESRCDTTVLVLSWEDVLAPMTYLQQRIGLHPTRTALASARQTLMQDGYLQRALLTIEGQMLCLLETTVQIGSVHILTQQSARFMEATCAAFFPRVGNRLMGDQNSGFGGLIPAIKVIETPKELTAFEDRGVRRVRAIQRICIDAGAQVRSQQGERVSLICVSAVESDILACLRAVESVSCVLPKCIQVKSGDCGESCGLLTLEVFYAQLCTLQQYLLSVAAHPSAFSMRL